jgi:hypothetical protein
MTNEQQAEMTANENFATYLTKTENVAVYQSNVPFKNKVTLFIDAHKQNKEKAAATKPDNSGYSDAKNDAKSALCESLVILTAPSKVALQDAGIQQEAEKLSVNITDFSRLADSDCKTEAKKNYNVMKENGTTLIPDVISQSDLDDLLDEIENFGTLQGESGNQHELSPTFTVAFEESFDATRKYTSQLKLMGKKYLRTNKEFYDGLIKSAEIPAVNVHHTYVEVHATWKNSGKPVEGLLIKLDTSQKTAITNWEGNAKLEEVKAGKAELSGELASKVKYKAHIVIKRGTTNHYDAVIEEDPT